jgi:hypothetical protein
MYEYFELNKICITHNMLLNKKNSYYIINHMIFKIFDTLCKIILYSLDMKNDL